MTDALDHLALCFGFIESYGHGLRSATSNRVDPTKILGLPWRMEHMDCGLLRNGEHEDVYDGRVFWTCGGRQILWLAFVWWDRSGDRRGASNSGFYVRGFQVADRQAAFNYAGTVFPKVIERQKYPLVLQP